MVRSGILLVVSLLTVANSSASVIVRHRPMHPDNTQTVTFEASATMADRVAKFRDQLDEVIELYFRYEPILTWRSLHNFWYSGQQGHYGEFCKFTNPPNMAHLLAIADAVAFLHQTTLRDCSNIPRMSSEIDDEKTIVHHHPDERRAEVLESARAFVFVPLLAAVQGLAIQPLAGTDEAVSRGGSFDVRALAAEACERLRLQLPVCSEIVAQ